MRSSWHRVKSLFARVASMTPTQRGPYLAAAGTAQRAAVEDLLAAEEHMGDFLAAAVRSAETWTPGECISGRYRIVRHIGLGGMGEVYEAIDLDLGVPVALKAIRLNLAEDGPGLARFRRELALSREIGHPNVCRTFDLGRHDGLAGATFYLSMELLNGGTLEERLTRDGPFSEAETLAIVRQVAAGLDAIHDAGVIHRDLKTSNVMFTSARGDGSGRVVITDFGLARSIPRVTPATSVTQTGDVLGTPQSMAPEQVSGELVGPAADIFAFGVLMYRLLTARYPFEADNTWRTLTRLLTDDPTPLRTWRPDISIRWDTTIAACLARRPEHRPARAADVIARLDGISKPVASAPRTLRVAAASVLLALSAGHVRATMTPLPSDKRIAVLRFSAPAEGQTRLLADAISESVSAQLDTLRQLDAHLSNVPFADVRAESVASSRDARRLFGVNLAITGAVRRTDAGTTIVALELVDAATGRWLRRHEAAVTSDARDLTAPLARLLDLPALPATIARIETGPPVAPGAYEFYHLGAGYLQRSGESDIDASIELFRRAIELQPRLALAHAGLARAYAKRFQRTSDRAAVEQAQRAVANALALDPSLTAAHVARGMVLRYAGQRDQAVQAFRAALQVDPADAEALNQLANTYDELGDPLRAEATFRRAVTANPGYWVGYNNLGRFYLRHRQFDEARRQFQWATELAPDNPRAFSNLGGLLLMLGRRREALVPLQRAYELQPTAALCSNLGSTHLVLGNVARAVPMFEQAVALAPADHRYHRNLGDVYEQADRPRDAQVAWMKATAMVEADLARKSPTADLFATAALYHAKLHDRLGARRHLAAAGKSVRTDDAGARLKIAQALELIGERDAAFEFLASAITAGLTIAEIEQSAELAALRRDTRYAARTAAPQTAIASHQP